MKILVTGHSGYVGSILSNMLLENNFQVTGCDMGYFPHKFTNHQTNKIENLRKDIRDITKADLEGYSAVVHLAALSNVSLCKIYSSLANEINYTASVNLAKLAKKAGVEKFIFSSSCSVYGNNYLRVNESSFLSPLSTYAKLKSTTEEKILKLKDDVFSPVVLRNATVYGISPSFRLDLVVNNLTASAYSTGIVRVLSDGTAWRPLVHVQDAAKSFIEVIKASKEKIAGEVLNVGSDEENYTVRQIAEKVNEIVPNSRIECVENSGSDLVSYKVDFSKIKNKIGFKTDWNLKDGINEIYSHLKKKGFTVNDFKNKIFYRSSFLRLLIKDGVIDKNLKFRKF